MKKIIYLFVTSVMLFTACKNNPVGDEALLIGKWQIMSCKSYSATNSANHGEAQDVSEYNITWEFSESTAVYAQDGNETTHWQYKLLRQNDNTLLLEFTGFSTGEEPYRFPHTIRKLTDSEMEWEHTTTGVAGPITMQEYLKKIN